MKGISILAWVLGVIFLATGAVVNAQAPTGTINGRVSDPGGAIVANAQITATNEATNLARQTTTNGDELYVLPDLPLGSYTVTITASGFATSEYKNTVLLAGRVSTVDAELKLASASTNGVESDGKNTGELTQ